MRAKHVKSARKRPTSEQKNIASGGDGERIAKLCVCAAASVCVDRNCARLFRVAATIQFLCNRAFVLQYFVANKIDVFSSLCDHRSPTRVTSRQNTKTVLRQKFRGLRLSQIFFLFSQRMSPLFWLLNFINVRKLYTRAHTTRIVELLARRLLVAALAATISSESASVR